MSTALALELPDMRATSGGLGVGQHWEWGSVVGYADVLNPNVPDAWWDDRDDPPDTLDANWVQADLVAPMLGVEANGRWPVNDRVAPWAGGGIGFGLVLGDVYRWDAPDGDARAEAGEDPDSSDASPVFLLPVFTLGGGVEVRLGGPLHLRLGVGVHGTMAARASVVVRT